MGHALFLRPFDAIQGHDNYFVQRRDGIGKLGLSGLQKVTAVFRMLAYGVQEDATDEYIKIGESTTLESLKRFYHLVVDIVCIGNGKISQQLGEDNKPASHLFANLADGKAPPANYLIKGKEYNMSYYLADGMYPKWSTLVQSIHVPHTPKSNFLPMKQEIFRKDVERAFVVLQSIFAIVAGPKCLWNKKVLHDIITPYIIMHNMIAEEECDVNASIEERVEVPSPKVEMVGDDNARFQEFLARHRKIKDK
ncbi:uncharacterized protein LOC133825271 [Humulus lupulus]|uniref:uncharacterized protein LOC133825271 n=1 Tax=Humulus lupulus TaxID=3486 RepID=UPI002B403AA0|nr:uncharacterized protein LOC133825271 [Humulus lupulus]